MTVLLEFKEGIRSFYGKYEIYLLPMIKFLLAFSVFSLMNQRIGYMERLDSLPLLLILALACSILPMAAMLLAAGALAALHCYALSMPAGVMMLVLFAVMYLLYFRFAPGNAWNALLTPITCFFGIPYVMPIANGLLQQPVAAIPTICGAITYYFLDGIVANETSLGAVGEEENLIGKFQEIIKQFAGNREMYLTIAVFAAITLVVYAIRRLSVDHAWTIAVAVGMLMQYVAFYVGYLQIGMGSMSMHLTVGCGISILLLLAIQFFFFDLDYTRTERVQFEDDEYYYYVKAVPKRYVSTRAKTVKKISGNGRSRRAREGSVADEGRMQDMGGMEELEFAMEDAEDEEE